MRLMRRRENEKVDLAKCTIEVNRASSLLQWVKPNMGFWHYRKLKKMDVRKAETWEYYVAHARFESNGLKTVCFFLLDYGLTEGLKYVSEAANINKETFLRHSLWQKDEELADYYLSLGASIDKCIETYHELKDNEFVNYYLSSRTSTEIDTLPPLK